MNENLGQNKPRQFSSNAMGGQMMSNNGKLIMSPGTRIPSNIVYMAPHSGHSSNYRNR